MKHSILVGINLLLNSCSAESYNDFEISGQKLLNMLPENVIKERFQTNLNYELDTKGLSRIGGSLEISNSTENQLLEKFSQNELRTDEENFEDLKLVFDESCLNGGGCREESIAVEFINRTVELLINKTSTDDVTSMNYTVILGLPDGYDTCCRNAVLYKTNEPVVMDQPDTTPKIDTTTTKIETATNTEWVELMLKFLRKTQIFQFFSSHFLCQRKKSTKPAELQMPKHRQQIILAQFCFYTFSASFYIETLNV